jgi:hypothetical protein
VIAILKGLGLEEAAGHLAETLKEENSALEILEGRIQELIVAAAASETLDDEDKDEETEKPRFAKTSRSRK